MYIYTYIYIYIHIYIYIYMEVNNRLFDQDGHLTICKEKMITRSSK